MTSELSRSPLGITIPLQKTKRVKVRAMRAAAASPEELRRCAWLLEAVRDDFSCVNGILKVHEDLLVVEHILEDISQLYHD